MRLRESSGIFLALLLLASSLSLAQGVKKHNLQIGVMSRSAYRDMFPGADTNIYYSGFFDTFVYTFDVNQRLGLRSRVKIVDYRYEPEYNERSDRSGFEIGLGVKYALIIKGNFTGFGALEGLVSKMKTDGLYYNDVRPWESKIVYDRRTLGLNIIFGVQFRIYQELSVVIESSVIVGNTRTDGEFLERPVAFQGTETYVNPIQTIGLAYRF